MSEGNTDTQESNTNNIQTNVQQIATDKRQNAKQKQQKKKDSKPKTIVLYMDIEDPTESIFKKLRRAIRETIREWVDFYQMPIRRKKLIELICSNSEIAEECKKDKKEMEKRINNMLHRMFVRGELIKIVDENNKKAVYYALSEHLDLMKSKAKPKPEGSQT